jgi:hypothetical protein
MEMIIPFPGGEVLSDEAAMELAGQWVTILAFGESTLAQVKYAGPVTHEGAVMLALTLEIGQPVEADPEPEPVFVTHPAADGAIDLEVADGQA